MTGVIVYKKDDTIGIRLTGESEGMGDHCGSVDGVDYFDGGVNSGVMTTVDKVEPRPLTFDEEGLIRSLLQPKPAATPIASSVPISGLSPAALARMMQLNQRMGVTPTAASPPRNKLPPSASTPPAEAPSPPPPQLSDPPTITISSSSDDKSAAEPALAEEKASEKKLSRLEMLRQKKEEIRKRKLELEKKVEENKKEKLQQQQQQPEPQEPAKPQQEEPPKPQDPISMDTEDANSSSPKSDSSQKSTSSTDQMPPPATVTRNNTTTSATDAMDEVASVRSKESSMFSKASRSSRDSIEELWIHELRHEHPASAAKYDLEDAENLLLEEDEEEEPPESARTIKIGGIKRQPELQRKLQTSKSEDLNLDDDDDDRVPEQKPPMRQSSLSRLQQLRQKKRLLEALPASIQTPVAPPAIKPDVVFLDDVQPSPNTLQQTKDQFNGNLADMAVASAAALGHSNHDNVAIFPEESRAMVQDRTDDEEDDDDSKTAASVLSEMEEDKRHHDLDVHHEVPAAFQESVTITPASSNPLPAGEEAPSNTHKRRRMLGLGFLPGMNREQKRQNTGRGHGQ